MVRTVRTVKNSGKKSSKTQSFEQRFPTKAAREKADAVFDTLPLSTSIGECIRVWEWHYLDAGGIVKE